ncbi:hypothetical protein N7520_001810 [Penicillium odoratum]|uniref:uncharacterized protein n=1 Tax=Penicillium odoratum TaxID=1167516 RepID=UPI0025497AF8|nr:uncharacterized protein N7520_001810 [Penicillium odoratum]KAJ5778564.1 hypothetical protein N7520_001810 [Penicillium odoratum]
MDNLSERGGSPDLNDLFDYDVGLDEIFNKENNDASNNDASKPAGDPSSLGLGLDEEVKITKKRQPIAKLDEARLLSQSGIPKLRQTARTKLRFKGKGHEFSDAGRLLNIYQLWLDDLFPRAKFSDGLAMIEKLGHSKRIQTMRREWIEEEKRKVFETSESRNVPDTRDLPTRPSGQNGGTTETTNTSTSQTAGGSGSIDDLFMPDPEGTARQPVSHPEPDDDDLEDLLREQDETIEAPQPAMRMQQGGDDDFDAEYEAMNEMGL